MRLWREVKVLDGLGGGVVISSFSLRALVLPSYISLIVVSF